MLWLRLRFTAAHRNVYAGEPCVLPTICNSHCLLKRYLNSIQVAQGMR